MKPIDRQFDTVILKFDKHLHSLNITCTSEQELEARDVIFILDRGSESNALSRPSSRRRFLRRLAVIGVAVGGVASGVIGYQTLTKLAETTKQVSIPSPSQQGIISVEEAISRRKSMRDYSEKPISLSQFSQILWAAQGITHDGLRTAPSAGALYPLEIYAVVSRVTGLQSGVYHYVPRDNNLQLVKEGDFSQELKSASLDQEAVGLAAANIVMTAVFERTAIRYGERGTQYVFQESGHAAQNIYLQATAMDIGTVVMGAFDEDKVHEVIGAQEDERPVYVQPIGVPGV